MSSPGRQRFESAVRISVAGPGGGPLLGARRVAGPLTVYGALGGLTRQPRPRHCPHRLRPGARRPAPRWQCSPANRPPGGPSGEPAIRNVRHSQRPTGPRTGSVPSGTGPGSQRRPGAVVAAGPPPRGGVVVGGAPRPGRNGDPGALTEGHRARVATAAGNDGEELSARAGTGGARPAAPPGRTASGSGGGCDGVDRRCKRSSVRWPRPSLLPRRPA